MARSISVSDMLFKSIFFMILILVTLSQRAYPEVIDQVVAYVDDIAITNTELNAKFEKMKEINSNISRKETLDVMINRVLLIKDAKKHRMESKSDDELIEQYIDLKIRSLIKVSDEEVRNYYDQNKANFADKSFNEVSEQIVKYLTEQKVNERLKENIMHLKENSEVTVNIEFKDN